MASGSPRPWKGWPPALPDHPRCPQATHELCNPRGLRPQTGPHITLVPLGLDECQSPIASSACSTRSKAHSGPCLRLVPRNCEVLARFAGLTTTASQSAVELATVFRNRRSQPLDLRVHRTAITAFRSQRPSGLVRIE
jgi:hypothetical protein